MASQTEFAILGLLASGPKSGYDIKQEVEGPLSHFWSISYGQIYPILKRLTERDLVIRRRISSDGRPDRLEYELTQDGWASLEEGFRRPIGFPKPRNELLLRLFFLEHSDPSVILPTIARYRAEATAGRDRLHQAIDKLESDSVGDAAVENWVLTARFGVHVFDAISSWCDEAEGRLKGRGV